MPIPIHENNEKLVALNPQEFICEPVYYKSGYTTNTEIKLRMTVIQKLKIAQTKLKKKGNYNLKIFDGFRSITTQKKMYNETKEKFKKTHPHLNESTLKKLTHKYVAFPDRNPLSPPPHNTGGAIDLTIINTKNCEIPMGTKFDDFTIKAQTDYYLTKGKKEKNANLYHTNRMLLKTVMEEVGFKNYPEEWWHFSYGDQEWVEAGGGEKALYGSAEK